MKKKYKKVKKRYFDYGDLLVDDYTEGLETRLRREYEQASREATQKLNKHLADFKRKDEIRRSWWKSGKWTKKEYIEWRQGQIYIAGRWAEMSAVLTEDLTKVDQIAADMITNNAYDVYAIGRNYGAYEIEKATGANLSYTLYDRYAVEALVESRYDLPLKTALDIPRAMQWNKKNIESAMIQSILQGESVEKLAKRLPRAVGEKNLKGAYRRARTLSTFAHAAGTVDNMRWAQDTYGIEGKKEWCATMDGATRSSHRALDGETVDVDEVFSNGLKFPGDPDGDPREIYNCRCNVIMQIKGHERSRHRLAEDSVYLKQEGKSYDEWKKEKPKYERSRSQEK